MMAGAKASALSPAEEGEAVFCRVRAALGMRSRVLLRLFCVGGGERGSLSSEYSVVLESPGWYPVLVVMVFAGGFEGSLSPVLNAPT